MVVKTVRHLSIWARFTLPNIFAGIFFPIFPAHMKLRN